MPYILITDIGSTTTKAVLFEKEGNAYTLRGFNNVETTVEKPVEDVKIGIYNSLRVLEEKISVSILQPNASPEKLAFQDGVQYLATSSAGGGLQILVLGLTLFDSASSAKRAAFGSGGVILDTFAINDGRSAIEKMQLIRLLRPDIILFSGGTDGGNISGIVHMGELLSLANPKPKFGEKTKIPLVYAGNSSAHSFIKALFSDQFDLHLVPNLRPTLKEENLSPARNKIHELFMENVMEQAPGYSDVKKTVISPIIPTPTGVIKSLQLISKELEKNIMAVDIGGATTDIFSNILGKYYRTVSANYGMSYSIANVLADASFEKIRRWVPDILSEDYIRNYIGNKMLYPTYLPQDDYQLTIEHAAAREAIRMARHHHMEMHFNTQKIGYLDRIKERELEKFIETFYVEKVGEERKFHPKDIHIMVATGGVLSNALSTEQVLITIVDGLNPQGITEIWRDKHFISPHLGKLSDIDSELAYKLLQKECYERIGLVVTPICKKMKEKQSIAKITIKENSEVKSYTIMANELYFYPNPKRNKREIAIQLEKGCYLQNSDRSVNMLSDLPILIDTRMEQGSFELLNRTLKLYNLNSKPKKLKECFSSFIKEKPLESGMHTLTRELPYQGEIFVRVGEKVESDTLIGEIKYEPPKVYVLSLFTINYLDLDSDSMRENILVKKGDTVKSGQKLIDKKESGISFALSGKAAVYRSPVRGIVEEIDFDTGTIILREIQDYSTKPVVVDVAKKLSIAPKDIKGYLKKRESDFVNAYEPLATKFSDKEAITVPAPSTGRITNIDFKNGTITIQYRAEPYQMRAGVPGIVTNVKEHLSAEIEYTGTNLTGIIGFGGEATAELYYLDSSVKSLSTSNVRNKIVVCTDKIGIDFMRECAKLDGKGIIAPSSDYKDIVEFIGEEIGVALTGSEKIPYPLILTEGFGDFPMKDKYKSFFAKSNGKSAYINGHTQIRAGVVRPTIIIFQ
jgi:uncharacterized protein (TIGR01319 family)